MLPRWSDSAQLRIGPERSVLVLQHRGLRSRAVIRRRDYAAGIDTLLAAVHEELAALPSRTPVHVSLSNHLVRFTLVPFNARVVSEAALATMARQAFRHVHGAVVDQWALSVSAAGEGTRLAAAVDQGLRQGLIDAAHAAGVHLGAIDPLLMEGYNSARPHLFASGWFAVVERGRVTLARAANGNWTRVISVRCDADWRGAICRLAARESPWTETDDDGFCQVADYSGDDGDEPLRPEMRVVSLEPPTLREAA